LVGIGEIRKKIFGDGRRHEKAELCGKTESHREKQSREQKVADGTDQIYRFGKSKIIHFS
jgi:hypothetical protein